MSDASPPVRTARDRRDVVRLVAAGVVILSFVALAVIAIAASRSDLTLTAPPVAQRSAAPEAPESISLITSSPALPALTPTRPESAPTAGPAAAPAPGVEPTSPPPPAEPDPAAGKPCAALGLPAPQEVGGLQSLIRLVPLFGSFSAEAFAMMPAFEPGFDVLGPLFPLLEAGLDQLAPVLDAITPPAQQFTAALYGVIEPGYGPLREDFLAAEAQLAAYLQPIVQALADAPGSECLIALEGLLASLAPI